MAHAGAKLAFEDWHDTGASRTFFWSFKSIDIRIRKAHFDNVPISPAVAEQLCSSIDTAKIEASNQSFLTAKHVSEWPWSIKQEASAELEVTTRDGNFCAQTAGIYWREFIDGPLITTAEASEVVARADFKHSYLCTVNPASKDCSYRISAWTLVPFKGWMLQVCGHAFFSTLRRTIVPKPGWGYISCMADFETKNSNQQANDIFRLIDPTNPSIKSLQRGQSWKALGTEEDFKFKEPYVIRENTLEESTQQCPQNSTRIDPVARTNSSPYVPPAKRALLGKSSLD